MRAQGAHQTITRKPKPRSYTTGREKPTNHQIPKTPNKGEKPEQQEKKIVIIIIRRQESANANALLPSSK